jgi:TRAP-type C4-dicarboxylate transport system permease small subunit
MHRRLNRILEWLEYPINIFLWIGLIGGVLMMLHVTIDVAGRTLFNHPFEGTTEIVSAWYMVAVAYLAWAWIARHDRHIHVDMFTIRMRGVPKFWLEIAVKFVTMIYVALFTWRTVLRAITQTRLGEVWLAGTAYIPVWPSRWVLPVAGGLMAIYLLVRIAADLTNPEKYGRDIS